MLHELQQEVGGRRLFARSKLTHDVNPVTCMTEQLLIMKNNQADDSGTLRDIRSIVQSKGKRPFLFMSKQPNINHFMQFSPKIWPADERMKEVTYSPGLVYGLLSVKVP